MVGRSQQENSGLFWHLQHLSGMRMAVVLGFHFHHMVLPDANEVSLQQAALLLWPGNSWCSYIRDPTYWSLVSRFITVSKIDYLIHRHLIININLPTVENCHLTCWSICCIQDSGIMGKFSDFWIHLISRGRLYLFLRKLHHTSRGPYNIHFMLVKVNPPCACFKPSIDWR